MRWQPRPRVQRRLRVRAHLPSVLEETIELLRRNGRNRSTRYMRALGLEEEVWREIVTVLSQPRVVLQELERSHTREESVDDAEERARLEREIASIVDRERRLVRLFTFGEVDEALVREEGAGLRRQRQLLVERLLAITRPTVPSYEDIDATMLDRACAHVAAWLKQAGEDERLLALEALQIAITATHNEAVVAGVLPPEPPPFIMDERASQCTSLGIDASTPRGDWGHQLRRSTVGSPTQSGPAGDQVRARSNVHARAHHGE